MQVALKSNKNNEHFTCELMYEGRTESHEQQFFVK